MKRGECYIGKVIDVKFPNKAIVDVIEDDGTKSQCVVKGALIDQKISFRVAKSRSKRAEGNLIEVLEPAEYEIESQCPHSKICGGCSYQNLPYEEQLKLKEHQVRALLETELCKQKGVFRNILPSPKQFGYRNKMEFSFGDASKDGELELGLHKRGSFYDIISTRYCKIVDNDFCKILAETLSYFRGKETSYFHKRSHEGYLRHLLIRKAARTGEILVDLVTTSQKPLDTICTEVGLIEDWRDAILSLKLEGTLAGILHTTNDSLADAVKDEGTEILYGKGYFYEEILGLRFKITPFSFFQTNSLGAEVLYSAARDFILGSLETEKTGGTVFDLYSGTGTIAQLIAPVADKVIGVEIVEEAVEAARENAELNGLHNCKFIAGDVLKVLDTITDKPDFIILDPPRDGINPKALMKIIAYGVESIVYISCKPTSLARDLEIFSTNGYEVKRVVPVDMFPNTVHVETVVLLSQQKPDDHIEIEINLDEIDATSAETKATYKEIQVWVQEKYGFHVTNLNIAQVKQKHEIIERENYNKPKSENSRQPGCPEEKVKAIEEALRQFQMIK